jgi:hypothetical protein
VLADAFWISVHARMSAAAIERSRASVGQFGLAMSNVPWTGPEKIEVHQVGRANARSIVFDAPRGLHRGVDLRRLIMSFDKQQSHKPLVVRVFDERAQAWVLQPDEQPLPQDRILRIALQRSSQQAPPPAASAAAVGAGMGAGGGAYAAPAAAPSAAGVKRPAPDAFDAAAHAAKRGCFGSVTPPQSALGGALPPSAVMPPQHTSAAARHAPAGHMGAAPAAPSFPPLQAANNAPAQAALPPHPCARAHAGAAGPAGAAVSGGGTTGGAEAPAAAAESSALSLPPLGHGGPRFFWHTRLNILDHPHGTVDARRMASVSGGLREASTVAERAQCLLALAALL